MRNEFLLISAGILLLNGIIGTFFPYIWWSMLLFGPLILIGFIDYFQSQHAVLRNFPVIGRFRYILEAIRPEINQYFIESNTDGRPFSRNQRSIVYQRAKNVLDTLPFGTQQDVYQIGYEWVNHSMMPLHLDPEKLRIKVGGPNCKQPYDASIFNISAMSYGSLSKNAILALNGGAKDGHFAHNTGEGGISPYHKQHGGDLIWQVGTGYFGCRNNDGTFNPDKFQEKAQNGQVKMIEIKISQGAKPGHGGILPKEKVTEEISQIRGVPMGQDVLSPPSHKAFNTPIEMMEFIGKLRELSGGKPIGFKICVGKRREFIAVCKAMLKTGIAPDFITVDGGEGGTGAAPVEFSNNIGAPGVEGLIFVDNTLRGFGLRKDIRILTTAKATTGFDVIKRLALGADIICAARPMMMALGCIQALRCNSNECPVGVATQKKEFVAGLNVADKRKRVASFHKETIVSVAHIIGTMGIEKTEDLKPWHIMRRVGTNEIKHYGELYEMLNESELLESPLPESYKRAMELSSETSFTQAATSS